MSTHNTAPAAVIHYGGGRQTTAMLLLVKHGVLPRPDRIVIADTGRENPSTWDYRDEVTEPLAQSMGMTIEIAPRSLSYVDLYSHQGDLLIPAYTATGKMSAFCSTEWKVRVVRRYLKEQGINSATAWIGYALDERQRYKPTKEDATGPWYRSFPLLDLNLTKRDCIQIITDAGLPLPPPSACWMCPNKPNEEWRYLRDTYPAAFAQACDLDDEVRAEDIAQGHAGVWLHHSRVPLRDADLEIEDRKEAGRQCGLGDVFCMNHCTTCGRRVDIGVTEPDPDETRCLKCRTAELFSGWRYDTPAMKRWRKKKDHGQGHTQGDHQHQSREHADAGRGADPDR